MLWFRIGVEELVWFGLVEVVFEVDAVELWIELDTGFKELELGLLIVELGDTVLGIAGLELWIEEVGLVEPCVPEVEGLLVGLGVPWVLELEIRLELVLEVGFVLRRVEIVFIEEELCVGGVMLELNPGEFELDIGVGADVGPIGHPVHGGLVGQGEPGGQPGLEVAEVDVIAVLGVVELILDPVGTWVGIELPLWPFPVVLLLGRSVEFWKKNLFIYMARFRHFFWLTVLVVVPTELVDASIVGDVVIDELSTAVVVPLWQHWLSKVS